MSHPICSLVKGWKRALLISPLLVAAVVNAGCDSMNHTEQGALGGTAVGAGLGALFGRAFGGRGSTVAGAAIGGAAGLVGGAIAGNAMDKHEEKQQAAVAQAQAQAAAISMEDIVYLTQQHTSDEVIIARIRSSNVMFHLTASDITNLKSQGVSDPVVTEMLSTANRVPVRQVYVRDPERPVVIYENPPPPPPVIIGVGGGYYHRW
jgi:surface antigen